jgi:hypothetical protein
MILALLGVALATDTWSDPHPGVRLLVRSASGPRQIRAMVIDTCAPGVSFRATDTDERQRTVSSFGTLVGAEAGVNGDFFSYSDYDVSGFAVGDGNAWSGVATNEGSIVFGQDATWLARPRDITAHQSWMLQAVSGRPILVEDGVNLGDFTSRNDCADRHPRTAVGVSQDRRTLILAVVDGRSSASIGMKCTELADLMVDLGAWRAMNLDGGGSSTMWVRGVPGSDVVNDPSDGRERVVGNHLAIHATGAGAPGSCDLWQDQVHVYAGLYDTAGTDVDGDGLPDLCARAAAGMRCYPSRPGAGWADPVQSDLLTHTQGWSAEERYTSIRMGDVTGDGRADVCARDPDGMVCWPSRDADSAGTWQGFGAPIRGPALRDADGWNAPKYGSTVRMADVDGDGRFDLCARSRDGVRCWRSTGTGFEDGVDGPALSDAAGWGVPERYGTLRVGDVNFDGRDDLCARDADGMHCWLSDGRTFATPVTGPAWTDAAGWNVVRAWGGIQLVDVDGDGRADLCGRNADGMACHLSTGSGFGSAIVQADVTDARGWGDDDNAQTFRFADLDGDGDRDVCARANAGVVCWPYEAGAFGTRWSGPELTNALGWDVANTFGTLRLVDVDGDHRADLVGRGREGVDTWPGAGAAFGALRTGPRLADASSWWKEHYSSTFRLAEPPRRPGPSVDTAVPGATDEDLDAVPGAKRQVAAGCATLPGATGSVGAVAAAFLVAAGTLRARRRR